MSLVDRIGTADLPPANFVAADVEAPGGALRVIGIVVRWNEIGRYLDHLPEASDKNMAKRTIVAGDFNLRPPAARCHVKRLKQILSERDLTIHTAGTHPELADERPLIDHIATTSDLTSGRPIIWPRRVPTFANGAKEVSDHAGSALDLP